MAKKIALLLSLSLLFAQKSFAADKSSLSDIVQDVEVLAVAVEQLAEDVATLEGITIPEFLQVADWSKPETRTQAAALLKANPDAEGADVLKALLAEFEANLEVSVLA